MHRDIFKGRGAPQQFRYVRIRKKKVKKNVYRKNNKKIVVDLIIFN